MPLTPFDILILGLFLASFCLLILFFAAIVVALICILARDSWRFIRGVQRKARAQ